MNSVYQKHYTNCGNSIITVKAQKNECAGMEVWTGYVEIKEKINGKAKLLFNDFCKPTRLYECDAIHDANILASEYLNLKTERITQ